MTIELGTAVGSPAAVLHATAAQPPSLLFVDDERNVLQGLRRMLNHRSTEWRLNFAGSGKEALAWMARAPVDVLISDMRMPEMDGAALLAETAKRHPETIRFILSGQSDKEAMFRAVGPCHQYLSKPCDGKTLEACIEAALGLRRRMADASLRRVVSKLTIVPALPNAYRELHAELEIGQPRPDRIESILARNPGLVAKLLQLANSAYFSRAREIRSLSHAVSFLGYDVVCTLALTFELDGRVCRQNIGALAVTDLLQHGLSTAALARRIARAERLNQAVWEDCFTAGVLHDIGILVLAENFVEPYGALVTAAIQGGFSLSDLEAEAFGVTHADIGAYLLATWGLPDAVVRAVADHHRPGAIDGQLDVASVLRAADDLTEEHEAGTRPVAPPNRAREPDPRTATWRALRAQVAK